MTRPTATLIGFTSVLLWALLALFTVETAPVPPLQLLAMTFGLGAVGGLGWLGARGQLAQLARVPLGVYAFGSAGLFGYHAFYFTALRLAPPAEAGLINYLWPLLIVLFSGLLPGERLRAGHVAGAALAFAGSALIVAAGLTGVSAGALPGYGFALAGAFTWAGYSVLSRRLAQAPTASVAVFSLVTALLATLGHVTLEATAWPAGPGAWAAVVALGLGPVGLAFYAWDIGLKRGDIQLLGTAAYAAPLMSTFALIAAGHAEPRREVLLAALMITAGAVLAAAASRRARRE